MLRFQSEYELIHGTNPVQEGHIVACGSYGALLEAVENELEKNYDSMPIIVIYGRGQLEDLSKVIRAKKY